MNEGKYNIYASMRSGQALDERDLSLVEERHSKEAGTSVHAINAFIGNCLLAETGLPMEEIVAAILEIFPGEGIFLNDFALESGSVIRIYLHVKGNRMTAYNRLDMQHNGLLALAIKMDQDFENSGEK